MEPTQKPSPKFLIFASAGFIISFILGSAISYFIFSNKNTTEKSVETEKTVAESKIPIGISLLENPIVYQWRGSVEGTVIAKEGQSITVEHKGDKLTMPYNAASTFFGPLVNKKRDKLTPDKIAIGTYVRGEFFTFPWTGDKNNIAISIITVEKSP